MAVYQCECLECNKNHYMKQLCLIFFLHFDDVGHAGPAGIGCNMQGAPPNWVNSPGEMRCLNYDDTPRITDIATTALQHLCIPIDPDWNLDGNALTDLCMLTGTGEPANCLLVKP